MLYPLVDARAARAFDRERHIRCWAPLVGCAAPTPITLRAFRNSLLLATLVGLLGTALGFLFAFTVARARLGRGHCAGCSTRPTLLPLISPPFTTSIAFVFSFGPRGFITHDVLGMHNAQVYGLRSTLVAEALTYFPLAYLALRPMLAAIGGNLEEMAFSLGSIRWRAFRTVTLPLTVPGLANAFLLLFAASLADFATPLILAGNDLPVLPTEAYPADHRHVRPEGRRHRCRCCCWCRRAGVFLLQRSLVARRSYVTVAGKALPRSCQRRVTPGLRCDAVAGLPACWSCCSSSICMRCWSMPRSCGRSAPTSTLDARQLPRHLHRRPAGDQGHADHRLHRHAARRLLRRAGRLSGRPRVRGGAGAWNWSA